MKVRFLKKKEVHKFKYLVKNHYKKNHILSSNTKLINFYYNYFKNFKLNLIGIFEKNRLMSCIGIIPYKNWDKKLSEDYHIAFWVKKNKFKNSIILLNYILHKIKPSFLGTSGINKNTSGKIFKNFGNIFFFDNHFIKNESIRNNYFIKLKNKFLFNRKKKELSIVKNSKLNKLPAYFYRPKKSLKYFINKYINNPFYDYLNLQFFENKKLIFFFICREIKIKKYNIKILRIVDFYGNLKKNHSIYFTISKFLKENNYEYIDFLSTGISKELESIGFTKKNKNDFLPEFFEPYDEKRSNRNYCILKNIYSSKILLVKGDGDGDRPNII